MTLDDVLNKLTAQFPKGILGKEDSKPDASIKVDPGQIHDVLLYLRDSLQFETLHLVSGVDYPAQNQLCVVYHPGSYTHDLIVPLKAYLPREGNPTIASVSDIYKAANWHERETFDMYGVHFSNHPELRRILCPEDWVGYPLRKDYVTPDYYNGMPVPLYFEDASSTKEGGKA